MARHFSEWLAITSDPFVLKIIKTGVELEFFLPLRHSGYHNSPEPSPEQSKILQEEIDALLLKRAIVPTHIEPGSYVSPIFTRENTDNSYRLILNLKQLNASVVYSHFKMETLNDLLYLLQHNDWMASIDLKNAYYTIPVNRDHQKYFTFVFSSKPYKFTCLPNGYTQGPYIFTKVIKKPFTILRKQGHISVVYLDDALLVGRTFHLCWANVDATIQLLRRLGFTIHPDKSILVPTRSIEFLGFIIDSRSMTVSLTERRKTKLISACSIIVCDCFYKIRFVASVIGILIAALPGVMYAPLFYRQLELEKNDFLKRHKGNLNRQMSLSQAAKDQAQWWLDNVPHASRFVRPPPFDFCLTTDASLEGWGATDSSRTIGEQWSDHDFPDHINVLELQAARLALIRLFSDTRNCHIQLKMDNSTAVVYINKMGGTHSPSSNAVAREIWLWAMDRHIWLSATYIPGAQNVVADYHSRCFQENTEWSLMSEVFDKITVVFFMPEIDLFASELNNKVKKFVSWFPCASAQAADAFSISWTDLLSYCFPPFSLIAQVLAKLRTDTASALVVMPFWTSQTWFPQMLDLLVDHPRYISPRKRLLGLPHQADVLHPLSKKLSLLVAHLSGSRLLHSDYLKTLENSLAVHGDQVPEINMSQLYEGGMTFVLQGKLIPLLHL